MWSCCVTTDCTCLCIRLIIWSFFRVHDQIISLLVKADLGSHGTGYHCEIMLSYHLAIITVGRRRLLYANKSNVSFIGLFKMTVEPHYCPIDKDIVSRRIITHLLLSHSHFIDRKVIS